MLYDNHGREINYLRLAVTDRCNLRCFYCMPAEGIDYLPKKELLNFEEMERLVQLLVPLGINKVRITGGEPFLRKGMLEFLERLSQIEGLKQINLTTNGTLTADIVPELKRIGIHSVNLSIDSLDEARFFKITRRDVFPQVMKTLEALLAHQITTKINAVVMPNHNLADIIPLVNLTKDQPIAMRFIEEMPFNGKGAHEQTGLWDFHKILNYIQTHFPTLHKITDPVSSTSFNYQVKNYRGTVGIIAAYSRLFCGTCNRIRLTPQGMLKTCLYDGGVFNVRDLMRAGATDEQLKTSFTEALAHRAKDGFEAEENRKFDRPISESMATIGG
ncbi:MAG: GTP 3',8-cyclase MoaA [Saprospiraceae bacterium]